MFLVRVTQRRRLCEWEKAREDPETKSKVEGGELKRGGGKGREEEEADAEQLFKATRD